MAQMFFAIATVVPTDTELPPDKRYRLDTFQIPAANAFAAKHKLEHLQQAELGQEKLERIGVAVIVEEHIYRTFQERYREQELYVQRAADVEGIVLTLKEELNIESHQEVGAESKNG